MPSSPVPRISIGVPVYNGERYLSSVLDSIREQTLDDFEVLISDNASTDATEEIAREYVRRDARFHYHRNEENVGAARNYRLVFGRARAPYFRWSNHDDVFAKESLASCARVLDEDPSVVLAYPKTRLIDADGNVIADYEDNLDLQSSSPVSRFEQVWEKAGMINVIYGLMRSETLRRTALLGDFPASDKPFVAELSLYGKFVEIPEHLFFRRIHPDAYSSQKASQQIMAFYHPKKPDKLSMLYCRHSWEAFRSVRRSPHGWGEKMRLYRSILKRMRWNRSHIAGEVATYTRHVFGLR